MVSIRPVSSGFPGLVHVRLLAGAVFGGSIYWGESFWFRGWLLLSLPRLGLGPRRGFLPRLGRACGAGVGALGTWGINVGFTDSRPRAMRSIIAGRDSIIAWVGFSLAFAFLKSASDSLRSLGQV